MKMSNSKMDTWPLQVRSMVERKASAMEPGSTGWQVHRRDSNSAQGSTHLVGREMVQVRPLGVRNGRNSRKEAARSGEEGLGPWAGADEAPAAEGPWIQGAHLPGPTVLPPEGVGWGLGQLVRVSTVLSPWKERAQLLVHVAEDQGQLGQLSPVRMGSEDVAGPWDSSNQVNRFLIPSIGPPLTVSK